MSLLSQPVGVSVANTQANKSNLKEVANKRKWKTLDIRRDMLRQPVTSNQQSGPKMNKIMVIDLVDAD